MEIYRLDFGDEVGDEVGGLHGDFGQALSFHAVAHQLARALVPYHSPSPRVAG
jgi:hypothetical protein